MTAASELKDAEAAARKRETELRRQYIPDMPACRRILTVEPGGAVTLAGARSPLRGQSQPQIE